MGHSISRVVKIYMKSVEMDFFSSSLHAALVSTLWTGSSWKGRGTNGAGLWRLVPLLSLLSFFSACCSPHPRLQSLLTYRLVVSGTEDQVMTNFTIVLWLWAVSNGLNKEPFQQTSGINCISMINVPKFPTNLKGEITHMVTLMVAS